MGFARQSTACDDEIRNSRQVPLGQLLAHRLVSLHYQNNQPTNGASGARVCARRFQKRSMLILRSPLPLTCSAPKSMKRWPLPQIMCHNSANGARSRSTQQTFTFCFDARMHDGDGSLTHSLCSSDEREYRQRTKNMRLFFQPAAHISAFSTLTKIWHFLKNWPIQHHIFTKSSLS
jgi:hypothetical protein